MTLLTGHSHRAWPLSTWPWVRHDEAFSTADVQVKRNVQRTLAVELQRLSVQFRKQQKQYLNRIRSKDGGGGAAGGSSSASLGLLDDQQRGRGAADDDFDPGFSELQV